MNRKIKVLYFIDGIGNGGGIQEMILNWLQVFDLSKVQVDILSYDTGKKDNYTERFEQFGGKVYIIPTFTKRGSFSKSIKETKKFFDDHNDYDILHAHASSKAAFIFKYAKKSGIKIRILHSHSSRFINRSKKSLLAGNMLKPYAKKLTTHFFACSHEAGYFLFGKRTMNKKGYLIYNCVDVKKFYPDSEMKKKMRKELGVQDNQIVIGHVGRFVESKNHSFLIDIFKSINEIDSQAKLVLVGDGELEESVKYKVKKLNLENAVIFLGYKSNASEIINSFDLFLMPSIFEGLPVAAVEAQAEGVNCLLSSGITQDVKILPDTTYLSLDKSSEEWARESLRIAKLGQNTNATQIVIDSGFDLESSGKYIMSLYEKFLKESK